MTTHQIAGPAFAARSRVAKALAERHRRERPQGLSVWREPGNLGRSLGLAPSEVRAEVELAERLGLVDLADFGAGPRVALSDLGWKLFDLDDRRPGRRRSDAPGSSPEDPELVRLLGAWRSAAPQVQDLADHLGRDVEVFWDEVLAAEARGEVETWPDHPAGPAVLLSAAAAGRLGLRLSCDATRWLRPGEEDTTSVEPRGHDAGEVAEGRLGLDPDGPGLIDRLADPATVGALDALEADEAAARLAEDLVDRWTDPEAEPPTVLDRDPTLEDRWAAAGHDRPVVRLPAPHYLLGERLLWPVLIEPDRACPGCRGRKLGPKEYCLVCDRTGVDDLIRYLLQVDPGPARVSRYRPARTVGAAKPGRDSKARVANAPQEGLRGGLGS